MKENQNHSPNQEEKTTLDSYNYLDYEKVKGFLDYLIKEKWKITIKGLRIEK